MPAASGKGIDPLRSYEEWQASVRNFHDWLGKAVPGATDLDFFCERNGLFLLLEAKPWTGGVTLPYGQHLAFSRLSATEGFTIYLIGEAPDAAYIMPYLAEHKPIYTKAKQAWFPPKCFIRTSRSGIREIVEEWWAAASD